MTAMRPLAGPRQRLAPVPSMRPPRPVRRPAVTPVDEIARFDPDRPLDPRSIVSLQRTAGNRAVAALVANARPAALRRRSPALQRRPAAGTGGWNAPTKGAGGWGDVPADSWNAGEMDLGTMRRIPIDGLSVGKQSEKKTGNDTLTDEQAGRRAILVAPSGIERATSVDVMVHLHGYTEKYDKKGNRIHRPFAGLRQHKGTGEVRDVALDRVEAQLAAANQPNLVAILAQGGVRSQFDEADDGYGLDPNEYAKNVLQTAAKAGVWKTAPKLGRTILSAHSGGGHTVRRAMERELSPDKKKVTGPSALAEVALFDAINNADELTTTTAWVLARLDADLAVVGDPNRSAADKTAYLMTSPRFRGYYAAYASTYQALEKSICGWFGSHATELGTWGEKLWTHYQVIDTKLGGGGHEEVMRGSHTSDTKAPAAGNITDAVKALGNTTAATSMADACGLAPKAKAKSKGSARPRRDKKSAAARAGGSAGGAVTGPATATTPFTPTPTAATPVPTTTSAATPRAAPAAATTPAGADAGRADFLAAVGRTTLELLPAAERTRFEAIAWVDLDYPDSKRKVKDTSEANLDKWRSDPAYVVYQVRDVWYYRGAHQAEAQALLNALSGVRPGGGERRANTSANAILTKSQFRKDPAAYDDYIESQLGDVPGEDVQMNKNAVPKYVEMRAAAKAEGVRLNINNAMRLRKVAEANAAKSGNAKAVASYSSHSLGLAMDLNLRTKSMGKRVSEVSTGMTNITQLLGAPAYKWMFLRGAEFGFYQYRNEPWHWEYNPKGFRDTFWAGMPDLRPAEEVATPRPTRSRRR